MVVYTCTKFHENILIGIRVKEQTWKVNGGYDIIAPVFDKRIKTNVNVDAKAYANAIANARGSAITLLDFDQAS